MFGEGKKQMFRKIAAVLFALIVALPVIAQGSADLSDAYARAFAVKYEPSAEMGLLDALSRLREKPEDKIAYETVRTMATRTSDMALRPTLGAMVVLNAAADQNLAAYKAGIEHLRDAGVGEETLREADVSDILVTCTACRGGGERCRACGGSGRCDACAGRGYVSRRGAEASFGSGRDSRTLGGGSLRASAGRGGSLRVACGECGGTGRCPRCKGVAKRCPTCQNSGKIPDAKKARARFQALANRASEHLAETLKDELAARDQTALLEADLRKARGLADPKAAYDFLSSLPDARTQAVQWEQAAAIRVDLEALVKAREADNAEKEAERRALRSAVAQAQRGEDPVKGLLAILPLFDEYATCDALPEAKTAFDGLVVTERNRRKLLADGLNDRLAVIESIDDPTAKIAAIDAMLADWPEVSLPTALADYAKANRDAALGRLVSDKTFDRIRTRAEGIRTVAAAAQAEEKAGPAWWVWAACGLGGLIVVYGLYAMISGALAARAEAARKAKERAAIDSIRNTFAHRRRH